MSSPEESETSQYVIGEVESAVGLETTTAELILASLLARGQVLIEDVPGSADNVD